LFTSDVEGNIKQTYLKEDFKSMSIRIYEKVHLSPINTMVLTMYNNMDYIFTGTGRNEDDNINNNGNIK